MALHVALNRTSKSKEEIENNECPCAEEPEDFTADSMREVQEERSNCLCSLNDVKKSLNNILRDVANNSLDNACTVFFCSGKMTGTNGVNSVVVKDFSKNGLEQIAAWLRNNGYYTDARWFDMPHGVILGTLLIYW